MSICINATEPVSYEFDDQYFISGLEILKKNSVGLTPVDLLNLANSLIGSGNEILKYIGECIMHVGVSAVSTVSASKPVIPGKVNNDLKDNIRADGNHDFTVAPSRCLPPINNCVTHQAVNAGETFRVIKEKYNIYNMRDYSVTAKYFMEDTSSTTIKTKLNSSGKPLKMNLIAGILDSAGCKHCKEDRHYNSIDLSMELYILNLGYIFYQSYFANLRKNNIMVFFMIELLSTIKSSAKKDFSENRTFKLHLFVKRGQTISDDSFILSNNRNFSVANLCKTLNSKTLTGLAKELDNYLREQFTDIDVPHRNQILTTFYVSGKGFGDFGQVFTVSCLNYLLLSIFYGNCFLITIDTFLFIIAILLGCPIIIGTSNFEYISIDDFLKYKGLTLIEAHNKYNNPPIFKSTQSVQPPSLSDITTTCTTKNNSKNLTYYNKPKKMADLLTRNYNDIPPSLKNVEEQKTQPEKLQIAKEVELQLETLQSNQLQLVKKIQDILLTRGIKLTLCQAKEYFKEYIKYSLEDTKCNHDQIYIECVDYDIQSSKQSKYTLRRGSDSNRMLLCYPDYFGNHRGDGDDNKYTDDNFGKSKLKTVMSSTLYTQYFDLLKFLNYINSNYYVETWESDSLLKWILLNLRFNQITNLPLKKLNSDLTKSIFYALRELHIMALKIKTENEKNYDKAKEGSKQSKALEKEGSNLEFYKRMKKYMNNSCTTHEKKLCEETETEIMHAWNMIDKKSKQSSLYLNDSLRDLRDVVNNCLPIYYILYKFIEDIMTVINNIKNLVYIIIKEIILYFTSSDEKEKNRILENLKTYI